MGKRPTSALAVLLPLLLFAAGCFPSAPKRTELMKEAIGDDRTIGQMRLEAHAYADRFAAVVEAAADEIIEGTEDPAIIRNAMLWKTNAIPACHRAIFQYDPLAALIDAWALTLQMKELFETGAAHDAFGDRQRIALEATDRLIAEAEQYARKIEFVPDWQKGAGRNLREWTADHPIGSLSFNRVSPSAELASLVPGGKRGVGAVMGSLDQGIADLSDRSAIYARHLPRQIRWQGEMIVNELLAEPRVSQALEDLGGLDDSLTRVADTIDQLPSTLVSGVDPVLSGLREERDGLTAFVDEQRLDTLGFLRQERVVLLDALRAEREATLAMLQAERIDTLDRLETLVETTRHQSLERLGELIDRALLRGALYAGCLLLLVGFLGLVGLRVLGFAR